MNTLRFLILFFCVMFAAWRAEGGLPEGGAQGKALDIFWSAKTTETQCKCLINWTARLKEEFPVEKNVSKLYEHSVNLYAEEYFLPVFGKPFPELSKSERSKVAKAIKKCASSKDYANEFSWAKEVIFYTFERNTGVLSFSDMVARVESNEKLRVGIKNVRKRAESVQVKVGSIVFVKNIESGIVWQRLGIYPTKKEELQQFLQERKRAILNQLMDEDVIYFKRRKIQYDDLGLIDNMYAKYAIDFGHLSTDDRKFFEGRISTIKRDILKDRIAEDVRAIRAWKSFYDIIHKGNAWADDFKSAVLEKYDLPEAKEAMALYMSKRKQMLESNEPELKNTILRETDEKKLTELRKWITYLPLNDSDVDKRISALIDTRIGFVRDGIRAKGERGYDWYDGFLKSRTSTLPEMIAEIGQVNLVFSKPPGVFSRYVKDDLRSRGIKEASGSPLKLVVETKVRVFNTKFSTTSTNSQTRIATKEYERFDTLYAYTISARIVADGIVLRGSDFYHRELVLSAGGLAISVRSSEPPSSFSHKLNSTVKALFDDIFKSTFAKDYYAQEESWMNYANEKMSAAPQLHKAYLKNLKQPDTYFRGLTEIGNIRFGENEERRVIGWKETILLQQMNESRGVFGRSLNKLADDFNGYLEWESFFVKKGISVPGRWGYPESIYSNWRPILVHEFSSEHTNLAPEWYRGLHGLIGQSYLLEPNCFVQHSGMFYRLPAATLYHLSVDFQVKELFKSVKSMTELAIDRFSQIIPVKN